MAVPPVLGPGLEDESPVVMTGAGEVDLPTADEVAGDGRSGRRDRTEGMHESTREFGMTW